MSTEQVVGLAIYLLGVVMVTIVAKRQNDIFRSDDPDALVGAVVLIFTVLWPVAAFAWLAWAAASLLGRVVR